MSDFYDHLEELRKRILFSFLFLSISFVCAFLFSNQTIKLFLIPFFFVLDRVYSQGHIGEDEGNISMIFTHPMELLLLKVKVSFLLSFSFSLIFSLYQLYLFASPGLYSKEKKMFFWIIILVTFSMLLSFFLVIFFLSPLFMHISFLMYENFIANNVPIVFMPKISEYFSFLVATLFACVIALAIPVFFYLFLYFRLISLDTVKKMRGPFFLLAFILAAIVTPPDILSQIFIGLFMYFLYEVAILLYCTCSKNSKE